MSSLLKQQITDTQGKVTAIERKAQLFKISSLAKVEDSTRN